ncbi:hypothetical protein FJT64_021135 [Amphibalanus amphitrite]|uniref:Uncharacterized protein n=1 Tax=Amphibalanus amphitrite TaxID=1232801 RepID=A0A6A4WVA1_AMPAM|nr:hypothetical protein FJT64_021135 [Amphibalanus amphitrite]
MDVGRAAGISLAPETLDRSHRLGRLQPGKVRPIIVKFTSFNARQKMFLKRKELSAERVPNHPTLTRSAITKIYISECLTPKNQHLMYVARQLKKQKTLWAAYSTNGIVKIKKTEEEAAKPIKCLADLVDIVGADALREFQPRRATNHVAGTSAAGTSAAGRPAQRAAADPSWRMTEAIDAWVTERRRGSKRSGSAAPPS